MPGSMHQPEAANTIEILMASAPILSRPALAVGIGRVVRSALPDSFVS